MFEGIQSFSFSDMFVFKPCVTILIIFNFEFCIDIIDNRRAWVDCSNRVSIDDRWVLFCITRQ